MIKIITPCSRENNLRQLFDSINFDCDWHIVFDKTLDEANHIMERDEFAFLDDKWIHVCYAKGGVFGNLQRNLALSHIKKGWVYFLDDDNLMHPDFYDTAKSIIENYGDKTKCIFFSQIKNNHNDIRVVTPDTIKVGQIDQAQFLIDRSLIGELRYEQKRIADGILINKIFKENDRSLFYFHNETNVTYYNKTKYGQIAETQGIHQ